jgi:hypothetical protein
MIYLSLADKTAGLEILLLGRDGFMGRDPGRKRLTRRWPRI